MSAAPLQSFINGVWYGTRSPPFALRPLAALFARVLALRGWMYRHGYLKSERVDRPVVVVGNITVGGTGKTPLVCWLAGRLAELGLKPGIATRGYGAAVRVPRLVQATDDAALVGDEAVLLARRSGVPVVAGRDRVAVARTLIAAGCDLIVTDDGLQHYRLARDCEIAVVDGSRMFGNGALLPAGPLREPLSRMDGVNLIVVNGGRPHTDRALPMQLQADYALSLADNAARPLSRFAGHEVHAVAGIGNPRRFFDMLQRRGIIPIEHPLADHAAIRRADISFDDNLPVLMTEKDAVKCVSLAEPEHFYIPVTAQLDDPQAQTLLSVVLRSIGREDLEGRVLNG